jgi:hypothetical protein
VLREHLPLLLAFVAASTALFTVLAIRGRLTPNLEKVWVPVHTVVVVAVIAVAVFGL